MRILMLGNSFTAAYQLTKQLSQLLQAEVVGHTRAGAQLSEQLNPKTKMGAKTQKALKEESWDYVVLQAMSKGPVVFSKRYLENVKALCEQIRANGAKPILYITWAYKEGSPAMLKQNFSYEQMHQTMQEVCLQAAKENDCLVANAGELFYTLKKDLYDSDGTHPNEAGIERIAELLANTIRKDQEAN